MEPKIYGADNQSRTGTNVGSSHFECGASANSAISANVLSVPLPHSQNLEGHGGGIL